MTKLRVALTLLHSLLFKYHIEKETYLRKWNLYFQANEAQDAYNTGKLNTSRGLTLEHNKAAATVDLEWLSHQI